MRVILAAVAALVAVVACGCSTDTDNATTTTTTTAATTPTTTSGPSTPFATPPPAPATTGALDALETAYLDDEASDRATGSASSKCWPSKTTQPSTPKAM
jgi:hypothetical protein